MEKNLYHLSPDERRQLGIDQLPETLGEHMFNRFVEIKRKEWDEYRVQVSRWELDRYLAVL